MYNMEYVYVMITVKLIFKDLYEYYGIYSSLPKKSYEYIIQQF